MAKPSFVNSDQPAVHPAETPRIEIIIEREVEPNRKINIECNIYVNNEIDLPDEFVIELKDKSGKIYATNRPVPYSVDNNKYSFRSILPAPDKKGVYLLDAYVADTIYKKIFRKRTRRFQKNRPSSHDRDQCQMSNRTNRAFTLIEVVVAMVLTFALLALSLTAVQSSRAAYKKIGCDNNLKQIGLATMEYFAQHGFLPQAQNSDGFSHFTTILPFIDQNNLYNSINFEKGPYSGFNKTDGFVSMYICPEETANTMTSDTRYSNYVGNRGGGELKYGENGPYKFPPGSSVSIADVTDGTSNTALVSENSINDGNQDINNRLRIIFSTQYKAQDPKQFNSFVSECINANSTNSKIIPLQKGGNWARGDFGYSLYNHTVVINGNTCLNGTGYQSGAWTVSSFHGNGANVLMGDSSVKFIKQTISPDTWRAIGSRNGQEYYDQPN